jgi:Tn3 transposase DDE domain
VLGERENSVAASLIFPSVSCSRGAASVYDLIEDENCLHEAGQSEISSIRKSALGSFRDPAGDRGPREQQSCLTRQRRRYQKGNTLMIQRVLTEPDWAQRMLPEDLRALTPLIYSHVTPYGTFRLDMNQRLAIEQDAVAA